MDCLKLDGPFLFSSFILFLPMKNFFRFAVFTAFITIFSFCAVSCKTNSDDESSSGSVSFKGGLVAFYSPNGLGDNAYVDSFCSGVQKSAIKNTLWAYDVCPLSWDEAKTLVDDYIPRCYELAKNDTTPMLFVFADAGYLTYISKYTAQKPDTISFLVFDSKETSDNAVHTVNIPLYGASYLAGLASKSLLSEVENPRVLSLIANDSSQTVMDSLKGFIAGYEAGWNGTVYDYNFTEWSDEKGQEFSALNFAVLELENEMDKSGYDSANLAYALALFAEKLNPFDLYFPVCGGSVQELLRYNREKREKSFYTIGMDSDLSSYTKQVPFSVIKHVDRAIETCVEEWLKDQLSHHHDFTLADGYSELVISKGYTKKLSDVVQNATQTAIEKETEYEKNK